MTPNRLTPTTQRNRTKLESYLVNRLTIRINIEESL